LRKRRRWFLVVAVVLVLGLSYAAYSLFSHTGADYLTVSELRSQVDSTYSEPVMVEGKVAPGSIDWDDKTQVMRFTLTDDRESLTIVYEGIVPNTFKPGAELIVVGRYGPDNVLEAMSLGREGSFCNSCH
jgi:cytochrome c-type biogenesis protein CcmE